MVRKWTDVPYEVNQPSFNPRNDAQSEARDVYLNNDIIFFLGPAGTGKTHLAVYCAISDMFSTFQTRKVHKIVLTRPVVEAGESLGFLPGEIDDKVHPYMLPIHDCVGKMFHKPEAFIDNNVENAPLAYMRGRTFDNCVAILDEAQNCTDGQLKLFMTRLGEGGKLVITGDMDQSDIGAKSGLRRVVEAMRGITGIGFYTFKEKDIVRHRLVGEVLNNWPKT